MRGAKPVVGTNVPVIPSSYVSPTVVCRVIVGGEAVQVRWVEAGENLTSIVRPGNQHLVGADLFKGVRRFA